MSESPYSLFVDEATPMTSAKLEVISCDIDSSFGIESILTLLMSESTNGLTLSKDALDETKTSSEISLII